MILRSGVAGRNRSDRGKSTRTENRPGISTDFGGRTGYFPVIPEYRPIRPGRTDPVTGKTGWIWAEDSTDRSIRSK